MVMSGTQPSIVILSRRDGERCRRRYRASEGAADTASTADLRALKGSLSVKRARLATMPLEMCMSGNWACQRSSSVWGRQLCDSPSIAGVRLVWQHNVPAGAVLADRYYEVISGGALRLFRLRHGRY